MNALLQDQGVRTNRPTVLVLAITVSLLIHGVLLFGPNLVEISPFQSTLPPLIAKLEPLPVIKLAPKPKRHVTTKPKPALPPAAPVEPAQEPAVTDEAAASGAVSAPPDTEAAPSTEATQATEIEVAKEVVKPAHPLPKHAELTFIAYKGTSFQVGVARHRLEINDDHRYTLQVGMNTTGLASLFKTFELNQQSTGKVGTHGLRPDEFSENKVTAKGKQILSAKFDWDNNQLTFSAGNTSTLPEDTQDILSFLYQFSQMPLDQHTLPMHVSNGRKLESYQLEAGEEEEIQTRLGKLRTLPLRKIHAPGEEGLEIWLGMEYRLLPVKVRQIDRNGEIAGELVISEIRVSEE